MRQVSVTVAMSGNVSALAAKANSDDPNRHLRGRRPNPIGHRDQAEPADRESPGLCHRTHGSIGGKRQQARQ